MAKNYRNTQNHHKSHRIKKLIKFRFLFRFRGRIRSLRFMLPSHDDRCLLPSPWFNGTLPDPPNDRLHPLDSHRRRSYPWPLLRQCNRRSDRRSHCTHCVRSFTLLLDGCSTSLCGVGQQRLHVQSCPDQANDTIQRWTWVLPSNLSSAFPNG